MIKLKPKKMFKVLLGQEVNGNIKFINLNLSIQNLLF